MFIESKNLSVHWYELACGVTLYTLHSSLTKQAAISKSPGSWDADSVWFTKNETIVEDIIKDLSKNLTTHTDRMKILEFYRLIITDIWSFKDKT